MEPRKPRRAPPPSVDMSAAAIDRRLRTVAELNRFGASLRRARPLGPVCRPPVRRPARTPGDVT